MKHKILGIILLTQIAFLYPLTATVIISDPIEDDGTWTLHTTPPLQYLEGCYGLIPTAGNVMMHMNNGDSTESGTNSIVYTNTIVPGTYIVSLDVGHWNNSPELATVGPTGLTAGSKLITPATTTTPRRRRLGAHRGSNLVTPVTTSTPTPALGQFVTWQYVYKFNAGDANIGARIGFQISVPTTGQGENIAFDRLQIDYYPPGIILPSTHQAVEICWDTEPNKNYQLQWATSINATNWFDMGGVVLGSGSNVCVLDSTRLQPNKFYRVLTAP